MATVSAPAGSLRGHGTITIAPARARLPYGRSLSAAGTGIDVTFSGVSVSRPLTVSFVTTRRPRPHDIPVVVHQRPDGTWNLARATFGGGRMTVTARSFSLRVPAWLDPSAWMHWLGDRLASLVGGRTPPISCSGSGPAWASISKQTDEVHTCLVPNVDQASHAMRAEVQIKSNRGVALEVDIPSGADYTWVQDQPWGVRSYVWAHVIHQDPNLMALLPAGATLTAGYLRPAANEDLSFQVNVSYWSLAYSLVGDVVDALSGWTADRTGMATLYLVTKCSGEVDYSSLSLHTPLSTVTFGSVLTCVINQALSNLSSPAKALGAARSLLEPGVNQADLATATKELTSVGGKLLTFGWVVQLWPVLQLGWGGTADVVHSLLTSGASTLIGLQLRGEPVPATVYLRTTATQGFMTGFRLYKPPCESAEDCPLALVPASTAGSPGLTALTGMHWSSWTSSEATGTGSFLIAAATADSTVPVQITLSQPVQACGHYYWSRAELTALPGNAPPSGHEDLFNTPLTIANSNDQPCPS